VVFKPDPYVLYRQHCHLDQILQIYYVKLGRYVDDSLQS
jgi:hypothetical protein